MRDDHSSIEPFRARLSATRGRHYWRSLEAVSNTPEFREFLHREFPENASEWLDPVGRRAFLKLMGASLALAGVSACTRQPDELIVPYVRQPEDLVPGKPFFYATAMPLSGTGLGLLVESHEGRPTKIEGNPEHPSSLGATDHFAQAAILGLYDPDRAQTLTNLGEIRPWGAFVAAMRTVVTAQQAKQGAGLRILSDTVGSPTLAAQIRELLTRLPQAKWHQWEPVGRHNAREGSRLAFGEYVDAQYAIEKADVILSLDADFLCSVPGGVKHARAFASRRRIDGDASRLNRLYAVESTPTNTGTKADHRLPLRASEIEGLTRGIAALAGVAGAELPPSRAPRASASLAEAEGGGGKLGATTEGVVARGFSRADLERWIEALAKDLQAHRGRSLVIPGDAQPPAVHALAHAMNAALGNVGQTVTYTPPAEAESSNQLAGLQELVGEMNAGRVDFLLILGGNPVYTAPADLKFADALQKATLRAHLSLYEDETAALCQWHVPEAHFLEAWSDVRSEDGTATIIQPLIAPLYQGKSAHDVLAAFSDHPERSGYDLVRDYWAKDSGLSTTAPAAPAAAAPRPPASAAPPAQAGSAPQSTPSRSATSSPLDPARGALSDSRRADVASGPAQFAPAPTPALSPFDRAWRRWLHDGLIPNTAFAPKIVAMRGDQIAASPPAPSRELEVVFRPDPSVYDGRFANNAWLQELPKALTRLTWDNAALISPATAERLLLVSGDVVELKQGGRSVRTPVWIAPGHAADTITLHLGYGRTRAGRAGTATGTDVNPLRTTAAPFILQGVELTKTGEHVELACTQDHWSLEGRNLVRVATKSAFEQDPAFAAKQEHLPITKLSMYPDFKYEGYAWGMTIDQGVCTGCNACVVACQAENNVPVVGKDQVLNGREMHWLRVDRYYTGDVDHPDTYHQPMPCQQCETAPCEVVCPVAATVHSDEGLNDMVYNRCVGTRYCSNNCPYKVRRFNFLLYQDFDTPSLKMQRNPDVTVRSRGVMEKCTYCVQRINQARAESIRGDRPILDGEILTACQSACPTSAIVFGDINDPKSRVAQQKANPLNYALLAELNTRPRTTYLAIVRNPNTDLEPEGASTPHSSTSHSSTARPEGAR